MITLIIIIVNVGLSMYAFNKPEMIYKWSFNPYFILQKKQYYRMITSGFIHGDWSHLLFNMITLFSFGRVVESYFGQIFGELGGGLYLLMYILGIVLSDIQSFFTHRFNSTFNSIGASGAVSAVIYSAIVFEPLNKIYIFFIPIGIPGFMYGVLYLIYCNFQAKQMQGQINHYAHFWGAIIGVIFTFVVYPASFPYFIDQIQNWRMF